MSADVGADGLLAGLTLNPRALRLNARPLTEHIVSAVRAAQRDRIARLDERAEGETAQDGLDPAELVRRLDEFEAQATRDFDRLTWTLDETLRRLDDR
ncbi:hypothetical protein [Streptosporangium saharense]|uniref:hypothetical protein n=1 Tax=Streptosporangium saharense TaxID=1706840 RepID=UPI00342F5FDC